MRGIIKECIETQSSAANQAKGLITNLVIKPLTQLVLKAYPGFNARFDHAAAEHKD